MANFFAKTGAIYYLILGILAILGGIILLIVQDYGYGIGLIIVGGIAVYLNRRQLKKLKKV